MRTIPRATFSTTGGVDIGFPYHAGLVAALKSGIPSYGRSYDPATKVWSVGASYADLAVGLLRRFFPDARIERPRASARPDEHFRVLHLLPSAPPQLIDGAYRVLARLHHPDAGGDPEVMRRLNAARDALRERAS